MNPRIKAAAEEWLDKAKGTSPELSRSCGYEHRAAMFAFHAGARWALAEILKDLRSDEMYEWADKNNAYIWQITERLERKWSGDAV